jgi:hypothetical protein
MMRAGGYTRSAPLWLPANNETVGWGLAPTPFRSNTHEVVIQIFLF